MAWLAFFCLIFIAICFCVGYAVIWACGLVPFKKKKHEFTNPYIEGHKLRRLNDEAYSDYIIWLDDNNYSLPIDKLKTKEELDFENEINEM
tara:strand:+ start:756 stop:1028 length:273 start_codon:yes stop_codon:yes gene_type:complete